MGSYCVAMHQRILSLFGALAFLPGSVFGYGIVGIPGYEGSWSSPIASFENDGVQVDVLTSTETYDVYTFGVAGATYVVLTRNGSPGGSLVFNEDGEVVSDVGWGDNGEGGFTQSFSTDPAWAATLSPNVRVAFAAGAEPTRLNFNPFYVPDPSLAQLVKGLLYYEGTFYPEFAEIDLSPP
jgi:hypothetical protein